MDFWSVMLIVAVMTGVLGWSTSLFTNAVYWYCDWRDGTEINWGSDVAYTLAVPCAWLFAIFEIVLLYCK